MKWECSPFGPSDKCGVYAVMLGNSITKKAIVVYIGSSLNIKRRVLNPNHHYRKLNDLTEYPEFVFIKFRECENFIDLEKRLIKRLRPIYNIQHSGVDYKIAS